VILAAGALKLGELTAPGTHGRRLPVVPGAWAHPGLGA
jgi:hypothetical protein